MIPDKCIPPHRRDFLLPKSPKFVLSMSPIEPIRLSALNAKIKQAIAGAFGALNFWVIADLTNHGFKAAKNYHYFELVEKDPLSSDIMAKISGSAWGNAAAKISLFERQTGQRFTSNINVLVNVSVDFHPVYGLRVTLNDIDPNFTLGVLEQQKQATLEKLATENPDFIWRVGDRFLTRNNQLKLPRVIQRIALITAPGSAGAEDFRHTLFSNPQQYHFLIDEYLTGVQGESNADQFVEKLVSVFTSGKHYDAVVITRGGGSQSDFLIFDNYRIGKAIAKFPVPVITGIGHQKNETIADLMAHTPLKTPTKAAEFIIAHNRAFEEALLSFEKTILIRSQAFISTHKDALAQTNQSIINASRSRLFKAHTELLALSSTTITQPKIILSGRLNEMKNLVANFKQASKHFLKNQQGNLAHQLSVVRILSPENILRKGFAIIKQNGRISSNADSIQPGDTIDVIISQQQLTTTVNSKTDYDGRDFNV